MLSNLRIFFIVGFLIVSSLWGQTPTFTGPVDRGSVHNEITEASGLAASRRNAGVLWTHNDSGDSARVFAMDVQGEHLAIFHIDGIAARDWEDMAVGPGPVQNMSYLYIGDIGDNNGVVAIKQIYRVPEPEVILGEDAGNIHLTDPEVLQFQYPGENHDAEALMIDPITLDFFVVTKQTDSARVFRGTCIPATEDIQVLSKIMTLPMAWVTAGDISSDGTEILLKTYSKIYYWMRRIGDTVSQALAGDPMTVLYAIEIQGEAVCWQADGGGYYTLSEQWGIVTPHLYFYQRSGATGFSSTTHKMIPFHLGQNWPNPFNGTTVIPFRLEESSSVQLTIYNLSGQHVTTLKDGYLSAGSHEIHWQGRDDKGWPVSSGQYIYRLHAGPNAQSKRLSFIQ